MFLLQNLEMMMIKIESIIAGIGIVLFLLGCNQISVEEQTSVQKQEVPKKIFTAKQANVLPIDSSTSYHYSWNETYRLEEALLNNIPAPEGFKRTKVKEGSFGDWLRHLPLEEGKGTVNYYNGEPKYTQDVHAAVIKMDVGKRDLQQCADAIMRVKAEYHYQRNEFEAIHFNFTSGDRVSFDDWRKGKKPRISGNKVTFSGYSGQIDNSYSNFKKYLIQIFSYAGTASLEKELTPIKLSDMEIGDLFIQGGSPGHAVLVIDMVVHESTGEKLFLLAQSYMPAQDFHILRNFQNKNLSPWYSTNMGTNLSTPEWPFKTIDLHRFSD